MSREIKFRAWDIRWKRYIGLDGSDSFSVFGDEDFIVEQFTGLRDKNGKEIYEGDILSCEYYKKSREFNNFIIFSDGMFCFNPNKKLHQVKRPLRQSLEYAGAANNQYEVVGNIHENPDLLSPTTGGTDER